MFNIEGCQFLNYVLAYNELLEYQGFNPRKIFDIILKRWGTSRNGANVAWRDNNGQNHNYNLATSEFHEDMTFLCSLLVSRGADLTKIIGKSLDVVRPIIQGPRARYNLTTARAQKYKLASTDVTMGRIGGTFPTLALQIAYMPGVSLPCPEACEGVAVPIKMMRCQIIAALWPKGLPNATNKKFKTYLLWLGDAVDNVKV